VIDTTLKRQLLDEIERLSPEKLARVYAYAHALASPLPPGASVDDLMELAGTIDDASARQMTAAIDEAFERVDPSEW
jgi:hypothetical protein